MRREKTQINKIRNEKGEITANTKEIIRDYLENTYPNTLENVKEMDKFIDIYDHSKLSQKDFNNINKSIASNEIKEARSVSQKNIQDLTHSLLNSTRPLKKN
jgi:hypothetical protein